MDSKIEIIYEFKPFPQIMPFGDDEDKYIHWYALTDSYYYINLGNYHVLEYRQEFVKEHPNSSIINDYYLQRLVEDIYDIILPVSESIPLHFYEALKKNYSGYFSAAMQDYETCEWEIGEPAPHDWLVLRRLDTGYLINGPFIGLYRCDEKILITWSAEEPDASKRWTAPYGQVEISYDTFFKSIKSFIHHFINEMEMRVDLALQYNWGDVQIRENLAERLTREKEVWESWFGKKSKLPYYQLQYKTNWSSLETAHQRVLRMIYREI